MRSRREPMKDAERGQLPERDRQVVPAANIVDAAVRLVLRNRNAAPRTRAASRQLKAGGYTRADIDSKISSIILGRS